LLDMTGRIPKRQRALAEALGRKARHDDEVQAGAGSTEIHRLVARRRLARQLVQGLVTRTVIRQISAMIGVECAEDLAEPASLIDDAGFSDGHEGERRRFVAIFEKGLRRTAHNQQAKRKTPRSKDLSWHPFRPSRYCWF
jgi:hypothetical protein